MFSLPLADFPGLPTANLGKVVLAAIPVAVVRNDLRFMIGFLVVVAA